MIAVVGGAASRSAGGATPAVVATCRELLSIARFDLVLLFTVIADMVFKPDPASWLTLLVMALALLAAGMLWLMPALSRKPAIAG